MSCAHPTGVIHRHGPDNACARCRLSCAGPARGKRRRLVFQFAHPATLTPHHYLTTWVRDILYLVLSARTNQQLIPNWVPSDHPGGGKTGRGAYTRTASSLDPHLHHVRGRGAADDLAQAVCPSLHCRRLLGVCGIAVIYLGHAALGMVEQLADYQAVDADLRI